MSFLSRIFSRKSDAQDASTLASSPPVAPDVVSTAQTPAAATEQTPIATPAPQALASAVVTSPVESSLAVAQKTEPAFQTPIGTVPEQLTDAIKTQEEPPVPQSKQANIDAQLVNSEAWQSDVAKGVAAWDEQMALLKAKVFNLQQDGNAAFLLVLGSYFDLPNVDHASVFNEGFPSTIEKAIESLFDPKVFEEFIEEKTRTRWNSYPRSVSYYVEEFLMLRHQYLEGANRFLDKIADNFDIVALHLPELTSAEREHNPMMGGIKLSAWKGYTRKFAAAHLQAISTADFFSDSAPRYIKDYRSSEMAIAAARFLWALMSTIRFLSSPRDRSTADIGIAFEKKLIDLISAKYPSAQISPTPKTGDQGADVILVLNGIKFVIQAKKYTGVVDNAAVQEVFAAKEFYDADFGMVVTSSRYTQSASNLAGKIGIELTTDEDFLRKIEQMLV